MSHSRFRARQCDVDLNQAFEANREHLQGIAFRMLGSLAEADDAVQEVWLRLNRSDTSAVENITGWLTTVVSRVCLDMLRSRKSRGEESIDAHPLVHRSNPEQEAVLADSVGVALLVVLERLSPAERLAFVLHDMFAVSFDEIASITGRTPQAARQLASRARRRVQGAEPARQERERQRPIVDAFLDALRRGDFDALISVLDPNVVVRADTAPEVRGAENWARGAIQFGHLARAARMALVDGHVGIIVAASGRLSRALQFTFAADKIAAIDVIIDPARLNQLEIAVLSPGAE